MSRDLCIVEGQVEKHFLKSINQKLMLNIGQIEIWNLFQKELRNNGKIRSEKWKNVHCIVDIDLNSPGEIQLFNNNIKLINADKIYILLQNKNFEEALLHCTNAKNQKKLFDFFNAVGRDEFKNKFLKCNNPIEKLEEIDFDFSIMYANKNSDYNNFLKLIGSNKKLIIKEKLSKKLNK